MPARAAQPADAAPADALLIVGRVLRAHGVRGEMKVTPETDDPQRFEALERVYVGGSAAAAVEQAVASVRYQPTKRGLLVLLKLADVDTPEAVEALRGSWIFASEADLPPLEEGEVFLHDLVGLDVVTETDEPVGVVRDVLEGPAQPLYVIARKGRPDVLVPAVPDLVVDVDLEARRITIRPIEGLLD